MTLRALMFVGAGALFLSGLTTSANATPAGATHMMESAFEVSSIDKVQHRRCWNCRPYAPPYFYRGYPGPYDPYYYGPLYGYGPGYYGYGPGYYGSGAGYYNNGYYGNSYYGNGYNRSSYNRGYAYNGNRSHVVRLQQQLARAGYYRGPIDGIMGSRTRYALRAYHHDHGTASL